MESLVVRGGRDLNDRKPMNGCADCGETAMGHGALRGPRLGFMGVSGAQTAFKWRPVVTQKLDFVNGVTSCTWGPGLK